MSASAVLLGVVIAWVAIGLVSAVVMGRRGYAPFSWLIVGGVLGPLVIPLALSRAQHVRELPRAVPETARRGPVDVLVGVDGSPESIEAARVVAGLVGDRMGRFFLAIVVDYDTALAGEAAPAYRAARAEVDQATKIVAAEVDRLPDALVLSGPPADALVTYAAEGRFDVLVVGSRGRGASKVVMGSVAARLARGVRVPVLMVSGERIRD